MPKLFHDMETLLTWLALCVGNVLVTSGFPTHRASNLKLRWFLCCSPRQALEQTVQRSVIWDNLMLMRHYCNERECSLYWGQVLSLIEAEWRIYASLVQIMACCLVGAEPLSEAMLPYCQLDPKECISVNFHLQFKSFHSWKCIW